MQIHQDRAEKLENWLNSIIETKFKITAISGDASFRRYFRVNTGEQSLIAVDAPPATENTSLFVQLSRALQAREIAASKVIACDLQNGFMLQADIGNLHLADVINQANYQTHYQNLFPLINKFQQLNQEQDLNLANYNEAMLTTEGQIFLEWYVKRHLDFQHTEAFLTLYKKLESIITKAFTCQPQRVIHRDFHCKNIMLDTAQSPPYTLIDFQGAVHGPITYDLVSLLRDCYLVWPVDAVTQLSELYRAQYHPQISTENWQYWFDLTGLQRHLKCLGIFCRLYYRDNKADYLKYLPNVLSYCLQVCQRYPQLREFAHWLETHSIKNEITTNAK
ncbi:aminoglycoside phosphotransferase family protein [Catenovulum sediminis]|uniref:Phosphotransferase n=1 Tax=Catenovulum sediminis TaxID=1740262 RepID=A0ABV1RK74_9ALTE|nr:phosphotransferase [Catenovulum sediminis]